MTLTDITNRKGTNQSDAEAMILKQMPYSLPNPHRSKLKFIGGNPKASSQRCSLMFLQWKPNGPKLTGQGYMYHKS